METISLALTAAETGHLCFATLHTTDAAQTVDRIIDVFPPHQQQQVRVQLSTVLKGVVCQTLLPTADGTGRVAAREIMVVTPAIANLIREGKTHGLQRHRDRFQVRHGPAGPGHGGSGEHRRRFVRRCAGQVLRPRENQGMTGRATGGRGSSRTPVY